MIRSYAKTDVGKVRDMNQDYYYVSEPTDTIQIFMLADGMGGYKGGEIASKLAIKVVKEYIENKYEKTLKNKESLMELVRQSMIHANNTIYKMALNNKSLKGMGTTLEVCLIYNNRVIIGHIGDSRIYRIRKDFTRKLTIDHSYVQKLVKDGTITQEEATHHPQKNMLMKALGCNESIDPDIMVKGFLKDDVLVLTSDGLTNFVSQEEIFREVKYDVTKASEELVNKANNKGGLDNITIVIVQNI